MLIYWRLFQCQPWWNMLVSLRMGFHQPFLGKVDRKSEYDTPLDDQFVIRKIWSTIKQNESSWNTIFSTMFHIGKMWFYMVPLFFALKKWSGPWFPIKLVNRMGWARTESGHLCRGPKNVMLFHGDNQGRIGDGFMGFHGIYNMLK